MHWRYSLTLLVFFLVPFPFLKPTGMRIVIKRLYRVYSASECSPFLQGDLLQQHSLLWTPEVEHFCKENRYNEICLKWVLKLPPLKPWQVRAAVPWQYRSGTSLRTSQDPSFSADVPSSGLTSLLLLPRKEHHQLHFISTYAPF